MRDKNDKDVTTTESEVAPAKTEPAKPTGRKYRSVSDLMRGEGVSPEVIGKVEEHGIETDGVKTQAASAGVRFASSGRVKVASSWMISRYAGTFQKLAR